MPKLLDQMREVIRTLHYSIRTEDAYADWARRFILFHGKQHPANRRAIAGNRRDTHPCQICLTSLHQKHWQQNRSTRTKLPG